MCVIGSSRGPTPIARSTRLARVESRRWGTGVSDGPKSCRHGRGLELPAPAEGPSLDEFVRHRRLVTRSDEVVMTARSLVATRGSAESPVSPNDPLAGDDCCEYLNFDKLSTIWGSRYHHLLTSRACA